MNRIQALIVRFLNMWRSVGREPNRNAPPPTGSGPSINLTPEQFHQLMLVALEDSPRAREIVRQAFLPALPIRGGVACGTPAGDINAGNFNCGAYAFVANAAGTIPLAVKGAASQTADLQQWLDSSANVKVRVTAAGYVGIGSTSPAYALDVYDTVIAVGRSGGGGSGGQFRMRSDDGAVQWAFGVPGTAGSKDFYLANAVNGHQPFFIQQGAPSFMLYLTADGSVAIGGTSSFQSSGGGGPELVSFQNKDNNHVIYGTWVRIGAAGTPTLGQTAGGSIPATTYYVKVTWVTPNGESLPSAEASLAVSANNVLTVQAHSSPPATATGFNVYVSTSPTTETKQNGGTPVAIGTTWTEPTTGLVSGGALPTSDTASDTEARHLNSIQGFQEWGPGGTNDQDVAFFRNWAGGLAVQSFNGTTSDHALAVQRPTSGSPAPVGADLFRIKTLSNITQAQGELALKSHPTDSAAWTDSDFFQATASVKTTDATVTTLASLTLTDGRAYYVTARIVARKSDGSDRAFYWRALAVYRQGGGASAQGSVVNLANSESAPSWDCTIDTSGNDVRVRVTGLASTTIYWVGTIEYQSVSTDSWQPVSGVRRSHYARNEEDLPICSRPCGPVPSGPTGDLPRCRVGCQDSYAHGTVLLWLCRD